MWTPPTSVSDGGLARLCKISLEMVKVWSGLSTSRTKFELESDFGRFDNTDGHMGISPITGVEIPHEKGMYTKKM